MAMQGNIKDINVADLIQHNCQNQKTAKLVIRHGSREAYLYFGEGRLLHATLDLEEGESPVYEILKWEDGEFDLVMGVEAPRISIARSWEKLLLEGARLMDEKTLESSTFQSDFLEENQMTVNYNDLLKSMAAEIKGFAACSVVGMDGLSIVQYAITELDLEAISAVMTTIIKLIDDIVIRLGVSLEDNLLTTANHYVLMRFFPEKKYMLAILASKNTASLGNLRMVSKLYMEKIALILPQ